MPENFQKTVNLRDQAGTARKVIKKRPINPYRTVDRQDTPKTAAPMAKKTLSKARDIDKVYGDEASRSAENHDLRKINRPEIKVNSESYYKKITFVLVILFVALSVYFLFIRGDFSEKNNTANKESSVSGWYSVKLMNGETYYGQIADTSADPIVLKSVYYNYDQLNKEEGGEQESGSSGNLRLVKRGKETHGPDGTMNLVRTQVVFMEPLKDESKVLKAILDYEE